MFLLLYSSFYFVSFVRFHVKGILSKYEIHFPATLDLLITCNIFPSSIDDKKKTSPICTYEMKENAALSTLETIATQLEVFLQPIADSLDTLVLLEWRKSEIMCKCVDHYYAEINTSDDCIIHRRHYSDPKVSKHDQHDKIKLLNDAVVKAKCFVSDLFIDRVSILLVKEIFTMNDVESITWSDEKEILCEYYSPITDNIDVEHSLRATFELLELYHYVLAMQRAFEDYSLQIDMSVIVHKVNYIKLAMTSIVTTLKAKQLVKDIKTILGIEKIIDNPCFHLFFVQQDGQLHKLNDFAHERGYDSMEHGYQKFRLECQIVTVELLHEEYDEQLLSAFQNTMSLVFPFLKNHSSLSSLWDDISGIGNLSEAMSQLSFVNEGMNVIRRWFNISEVSFHKLLLM